MQVPSPRPGPQRWKGTIRKIGVNPYLEVPKRVSDAYGVKGPISIVAEVGAGRIATTLVPVGNGRHRLYVNTAMLKAGQVEVGDPLSIQVAPDSASRMPPVPSGLAAGLTAQPSAQRAWAALPPSRRKEVLRYLNFAKTAETLERNVVKALRLLGDPSCRDRLGGIAIHGPR